MSVLNEVTRTCLLRAGFTEREINTQKQKFYNLFNVHPMFTTELQQMRRLMDERHAMLAALTGARSFIKEQLDSLVEGETNPVSGLVEDAGAVLVIESQQDLLNSIDAAIAQAQQAEINPFQPDAGTSKE